MLIKMSIKEYQKTYFTENSAPCKETIRRQIKKGILQGAQSRPKGKFYVLVKSNKTGNTGNSLADSIISTM